MSGPLNFKAQALDNTSPDHYQIGDKILSPGDQSGPRQVANMISEIARDGTHQLNDNGAELIVLGSRFLTQVYSVQLDHANRRAPILCCGNFSRDDDPQAVIQAIIGFAAKIGRTIEPRHIDLIRDGLAGLKKKSRVPRLAAGIGIIVLLAALILFGLHRGRSRTQMHNTSVPSMRTPTAEK